MKFYCATQFLFPRHFALRIFLLCFLSVHLPILAYGGTMVWLGEWSWPVFLPLLLATVLGTAVAIGGMAGLLQPLRIATEQLSRLQNGEPIDRVPQGGPDMAGRLLAAVAHVAVAVEQRIATIKDIADTDRLTGLYNRRGLEEAIDASLKIREEPGAIALLDGDCFKEINDTLGHDAGDEALRGIARRISENVRGQDVVGRWGGDEFVIFFPGLSTESAQRIVVRVQAAMMRRPVAIVDGRALSCSFGVAQFDGQAPSAFEDALKQADAALYEMKRARKDAGGCRAAARSDETIIDLC